MLKRYDAIMKEQKETRIIEEVSTEEIPEVGRTYYMPHQAVVRENKITTKLRVVYDASSKTGLNSLKMTVWKPFQPNSPTCLKFYCNSGSIRWH